MASRGRPVQDAGGEAYNVVIDIADPVAVGGTGPGDPDRRWISSCANITSTRFSGVANTIFPQGLLDRHGARWSLRRLQRRVLPRMKQMTRDWGRYFERMTAWKKIKGKEVTSSIRSMIYPLHARSDRLGPDIPQCI